MKPNIRNLNRTLPLIAFLGYLILLMPCQDLYKPIQHVVYIEIHDVSPAYNLSWLRNIVSVIEKHKNERYKVYLMVIPNHKGVNPINESEEFVSYIRSLQHAGYIVCMHGYTHTKGEFYVRGKREKLLRDGIALFESAGIGKPTCYCPPWWDASSQEKFLKQNFNTIFLRYYIYNQSQRIYAPRHEYTGGLTLFAVERAKMQSFYSKYFRIVVHIEVGSNPSSLKLLDNLLSSLKP